MKSILTKEIAKEVIKARLSLIIPICIIGLLWSMYRAYSYTEDMDLVLQTILPFTGLMAAIAIFVGMRIAIGIRTNNTYLLNDTDLIHYKGAKEKKIALKKIKRIKENSYGLVVKTKRQNIYLPKQMDKYEAFKKQLYTVYKQN